MPRVVEKKQPSSSGRRGKVYTFRLSDREAEALRAADEKYIERHNEWWRRGKPSPLAYCVRLGLKAVKMERSRW